MAWQPPKDPGELRTPASYAKFTETGTDENGQPEGRYDPCGSGFVKLEMVNARTVELVQQLYDEATHLLTARYNPVLRRGVRVIAKGQTLWIGAVDNWLERNQWVRCLCREEFPDG